MNAKKKDALADQLAVAQEQEAGSERDRHLMEEAVLTTLARDLPAGPFVGVFADAFIAGNLTFSRGDLAAVAGALWELAGNMVAADKVLVRDKLAKPDAVSDEVMARILDRTRAVDATVAGEYIRKLAALDLKRRALDAGREYLAKVEAGAVEDGVGELVRAVCNLTETKRLTTPRYTEKFAAANFLAELERRRNDGRDWLGLDTGFRHLNEVLNGLTEGVFILAGPPSLGKTTLAKQVADHVAAGEQVPVLFYSFEQSAAELRIKSLARHASVNSRTIMKGRSCNADWAKVEEAAREYLEGPGPYLTIVEAGATDTVPMIRTAALMAKYRAGGDKPVLLVLDYLQIIPTPPDVRTDNAKTAVDWNLSELRRLSRELKSPVLVVSSLNRAAYKDDDKEPTMVAMKESGGIEYTADGVVALWRNNNETKRLTDEFKRKTVRVEALVLKNRNGETAKVKLDFTPEWALFTEVGKEDLEKE